MYVHTHIHTTTKIKPYFHSSNYKSHHCTILVLLPLLIIPTYVVKQADDMATWLIPTLLYLLWSFCEFSTSIILKLLFNIHIYVYFSIKIVELYPFKVNSITIQCSTYMTMSFLNFCFVFSILEVYHVTLCKLFDDIK